MRAELWLDRDEVRPYNWERCVDSLRIHAFVA